MLSIISIVTAALASNYPPDYVVMRSCLSQGSVQVCALNKGANNPRIEVNYYDTGLLWSKASPITLWASMNGKHGQLFGNLTAIERDGKPIGAQYTINKLKNVKFCYQATIQDEPEYAPGGFARCPVTIQYPLITDRNATQGNLGWFFEPSLENEFKFISSAESFGGWEVQVAFVNAKGDWDSRLGRNYNFYFR
jgi:hypothetical protein